MIKAVFSTSHADLLSFHERLTDLLQGSKVARTAATNLDAMVSRRIQQEGKLTNGELIGGGKYSTKELKSFGSAFNFTEVSTVAQRRRRERNGETNDQFDGGYKEYRESLGRQTRFIDLTLTGAMMSSFTVIPIGRDGWGIGFSNGNEYQKHQWLTDRFGVFAQASKEEIELSFKDIITDTENAIRAARK